MKIFLILIAFALLACPAFGQLAPGQVLQQMNQAQLNSLPPAMKMTELNRRAAIQYSKDFQAIRSDHSLSQAERHTKIMERYKEYQNELYDNGDAYFKARGMPINQRPAWLQTKPSTSQGILNRIFGK